MRARVDWCCTPTRAHTRQVNDRTLVLQRQGALPARETCDLVIVDRCVDAVAPVIHEWTYEALVYDLLSLEDNIIRCAAFGARAVWWHARVWLCALHARPRSPLCA
jgi:hypothetical protein